LELTSELEEVLKGKVVSTVDYTNNKKVIGISETTLTPTANGPAPLSKQGAFEAKVQELDTLASAAEKVLGYDSNNAVPILDPMAPQQGTEKRDFIIPEPQADDNVLSVAPVFLDNEGARLATLEEEKEKETKVPEEPLTPSFDVSFNPNDLPPVIGEGVIAAEPAGVNENLFSQAPSDVVPQVVAPSDIDVTRPLNAELPNIEVQESVDQTPQTAPVSNNAESADIIIAKYNEVLISKVTEYLNNILPDILKDMLRDLNKGQEPISINRTESAVINQTVEDGINRINSAIEPAELIEQPPSMSM
jgi:hypothetical protein